MICELCKYQRCASQTSKSLRTPAISPVDLVKNLQCKEPNGEINYKHNKEMKINDLQYSVTMFLIDLIPGWRIGLQEDAHGFLLKLLEGLNERASLKWETGAF